MEKNILILDKLSEMVNEKMKSVYSVQGHNDFKMVSITTLSSFLSCINQLKQEEKENSRIDFKEGYLEAVLDYGDTFGLSKEEAFPNDDEMEIIEKKSFDFVERKFK